MDPGPIDQIAGPLTTGIITFGSVAIAWLRFKKPKESIPCHCAEEILASEERTSKTIEAFELRTVRRLEQLHNYANQIPDIGENVAIIKDRGERK